MKSIAKLIQNICYSPVDWVLRIVRQGDWRVALIVTIGALLVTNFTICYWFFELLKLSILEATVLGASIGLIGILTSVTMLHLLLWGLQRKDNSFAACFIVYALSLLPALLLVSSGMLVDHLGFTKLHSIFGKASIALLILGLAAGVIYPSVILSKFTRLPLLWAFLVFVVIAFTGRQFAGELGNLAWTTLR